MKEGLVSLLVCFELDNSSSSDKSHPAVFSVCWPASRPPNMNRRGDVQELHRKPVPNPLTMNPSRQATLTERHQDQEDVGQSRAVAAWLTLMENDRRQSRNTASFSNYTAASSMDYQPRLPRSRLSVMEATRFRTTRQRETRQEPQHHPFEVSPLTTSSEHLPALAFVPKPTVPAGASKDVEPQPFESTATMPRGANDDELSVQSTVPLTVDLRDGMDKRFSNLEACTSSNAVAVAVAVTAKPQPRPICKDMSAVALRLQDQPVVKSATGKRSHRPRIIAVRSRTRLQQHGEGDDTSSRPEDKGKAKVKDKVNDKDKNKNKGKKKAMKNKNSPKLKASLVSTKPTYKAK